MKKILALIILCTALFSCTREIELSIQAVDETASVSPTILPPGFPSTIVASVGTDDSAGTKTDYTDGKSQWVLNDQVCLYYVDDLETPTSQAWIAYTVTSLSPNGRTATFTVSDGQTDKANALAAGNYKSTGVVLYPYKSARPNALTEYDTFGIDANYEHKPFITIKSEQTGNYSEVIMLGKSATVDENTLNVDMKNATSIMKVTVTGIPADASKFKLCSSDPDLYPSGDFLIDINASAPLQLAKSDYRKYTYSANLYHTGSSEITINRTSAWDDGSQDFYFTIPTGTYDANSITLKLLDSSDNVLMEKPLKSAFTFERNKLISGITLANVWTTLGVGKFVDNFLWYKITVDGYNSTVARDIPDYVDVTIQQNLEDPNTYRLVHPYQNAASQFGYSSTNSAATDPYFVFTVSGNSVGASVSFNSHRTGFAIDSGHINPVLISSEDYNTAYSTSYTSAQNYVVAAGTSTPAVVQLAPIYQYPGSSTAYTNLCDKMSIFRVIFPDDKTSYDCVLEPYGACDSRLNVIRWDNNNGSGGKSPRMRFVFSQYTDYEIAAGLIGKGYYVTKDKYPGYVNHATSSNTAWNPSGSLTNIPSGPIYLTWYSIDKDGETKVYSQGRKKVYFLNPEDYSALCKQHTIYATGLTHGTMTFAISDSPTTSNIKLVEFDGMEPTPNSTLITSSHRIFSAFDDWIVGDGYPYSSEKLLSGEPMYGTYSNGSISLDATHPFFKYGTAENNGSIYIFSTGANSNNNPVSLDFSFDNINITSKSNSGITKVRARFYGYSGKWAGQDGGGKDYVSTHVTTVPTTLTPIDMSSCTVTTNSTESGSNISYITDCDRNTHWHSIWSTTRQYDATYGVYINVALPRSVSKIQVNYYTRSDNANGCPREVAFWGSADGSSWTKIGENQTISTKTTNTLVTLPTLEPESAISYLRMGITKYGTGDPASDVTSSSGFTSIAELILYEVN